MIKHYRNINEAFEERVQGLESIFSSFRTLHEMYVQIMKTAQVNSNALTAFERLKSSAATEQEKISEGLYAQGFILLTGAAEALLKDVFDSLLIENFIRMKVASGVNFSAKEIQEVMLNSKDGLDNFEHVSAAFGRLTKQKIYKDTKNPTEKINFQNVQTMIEIFKQYFGIDIEKDSVTNSIHRSWQVRHCIVHNDSTIDERFVNNVSKVSLLKKGERNGKKITIKKDDYLKAKADFMELFTKINTLIINHELESRFVQKRK